MYLSSKVTQSLEFRVHNIILYPIALIFFFSSLLSQALGGPFLTKTAWSKNIVNTARDIPVITNAATKNIINLLIIFLIMSPIKFAPGALNLQTKFYFTQVRHFETTA